MQQSSAATPSVLSEAGFRSVALKALYPSPPSAAVIVTGSEPASPSDFDLNPGLYSELPAHPAPRPAAVLVPVVAHAALTVLLTQRTDGLAHHPGQIAFPGGKMEPDETPLATALREANEEIGLDPAVVEPLGYLDPYRTGTGYLVFPVVALVRNGFTLKLDPREVADAFEVPLAFLMDTRNHAMHTRPWRGGERRFYAMPFEQRYIWGATAGILKNMHQRLFSR